MSIEERRARDRAARRELITTVARAVAEREGWEAVTTRRLSTEIEYSQPVIYKHFASLEAITDAVALQGFQELAEALREARRAADPTGAVEAVAYRYVAFANEAPALYEAMFSRSSRLPFGGYSPTALSAAFAEVRAAVQSRAGNDDVDLLTEVFWGALHGLVALERGGRISQERVNDRIGMMVNRLLPHRT